MALITKKQAVITGVGSGYFQEMTTEDTQSSAPVYADTTYQSPSLESVEAEIQQESTELYLSNTLHSRFGKVTGATITLNAGYLPEGFAEKMTGATELAPGVYAQTGRQVQKFFRLAFPMTDENGDEIIINFPKCQLEPVSLSATTEGESQEGQIDSYNIVAVPMTYEPKGEADKELSKVVYLKADLRNEGAKEAYDRDQLLEKGWYDGATLAAALKSPSV